MITAVKKINDSEYIELQPLTQLVAGIQLYACMPLECDESSDSTYSSGETAAEGTLQQMSMFEEV